MSTIELKQNSRLTQLAVGILVGLWMMTPGWVSALPSGEKIVSGNGGIVPPVKSVVPNQDMVIKQNSSKLIINWNKFSIDKGESVTFMQPNSSSVALNRVIGTDPSIILGKLSANGQVFLSNPSGVVFGQSATVDVHGLLATTLNISNADFLNGNYRFSQDPSRPLAAIINDGVITATNYVGLAAPAVENNGPIVVADMGSIALASGTATTMDFNGDGLIRFVVTDEVSGDVFDTNGKMLKDRILNSGIIRANGGQVLLTAKSAGDVIGNVVNHTGIIEAQTVRKKDGRIILSSGGSGTIGLSGDIDLKGKLDAGAGDVVIALTNGDELNLAPGNPRGSLGGIDLGHIIAKNLILQTGGDINVKGITEKNTDTISGSVILESGRDITFDGVASTFPALELLAVNDINVNKDVTTTRSDFVAVADSDTDGKGDFNVAPGVVITSARDIDVSAPTINAESSSFKETRNLILNGNGNGNMKNENPISPLESESIVQGSLGTFLTDFFQNGGPGGC
jgi:filamentous hemagglutinin family protein